MAAYTSPSQSHLISFHFHVVYLIFFTQTLTQTVTARRVLPQDAYTHLYKAATDAYLDERWHDCANLMTRALDDYKFYWNSIIFCGLNCRDKEVENNEKNSSDIAFYLSTVKMSLCLLKCKKSRLGLRMNSELNPEVERAFENKVTYDYLQLCQFKKGNVQAALSSAYTFLSYNPDHEAMKYNFNYYSTMAGVQLHNVKNLETRTFQELYLMGNDAYNKQQYHEVKHYFESAAEEYLIAEDECRVKCEGPFDNNANLDFVIATANHFTFTLKCKQKCPRKLSMLYGEQIDDYYSSHFHYLQFAYFKVDEIINACRAVATYLLFHPEDDTMLKNKEYYLSLKGVTEDDFKPGDEAVEYWKRDKAEKDILKYIKESFEFDDIDVEEFGKEDNADTIPTPSETPVIISTGKSKKESGGKTREKMTAPEIKLIHGEKELNGTLRFVADGISTSNECDHLLHLAEMAAVNGDGYNGVLTPLTKFERFEGLTVGRAAILAKLGMVDVKKAQLFLDISERGRHFVEKYFKLKSELFFTYTHLVCRTALETSTIDRTDLSHPVHADNCLLQSDGSCRKEKPAFTYRDYSAVIYLNDDFDGGNFVFFENKTEIQAKVEPKCGRLVGFSAGRENLHGVDAVVKGRRCALAMWFTLDPDHREKERDLAQLILDRVINDQSGMKLQCGLNSTSSDINYDKFCNKLDYYLYFTDLKLNINQKSVGEA